eukprot:TRINITY_DN8732_c0_g2_i1.p2 TRINITY_DN8732_c0_g2~~TRINITY_DN8732_c0_g2_i1.p2  ORF type:complete len:137 (+),score=55.91 TRINITY_DN8732_c0_g2_i1:63-413(+)
MVAAHSAMIVAADRVAGYFARGVHFAAANLEDLKLSALSLVMGGPGIAEPVGAGTEKAAADQEVEGPLAAGPLNLGAFAQVVSIQQVEEAELHCLDFVQNSASMAAERIVVVVVTY